MSLSVVFRPQAETEIGEAADWYEAKRYGLGDQFLVCIEAAIERVSRAPESCVRAHDEVRRALVRRFPYCVYYQVEGTDLVILAVAHEKREPGYWADRL